VPSSWHHPQGERTSVSYRRPNPQMPIVAEGKKVIIPEPFEPSIQLKEDLKKISSRKASLPPI
jgi:hypothetical protein